MVIPTAQYSYNTTEVAGSPTDQLDGYIFPDLADWLTNEGPTLLFNARLWSASANFSIVLANSTTPRDVSTLYNYYELSFRPTGVLMVCIRFAVETAC